MKRFLIVILCIFIPLLLTSCWNYREVDNLTLARGIAIDKTEDGSYFISVETADMHEAGKEGKAKSVVIESEGETMFEAVRNAIQVNVPKLYWGHASIIIISQQVAQEGVVQIMDFLTRDAETRLDLHPVIFKGEKAKDVFEGKPLTAEIMAEELSDMLNEEKSTSVVLDVQLFQFIECLSDEGISAIMPAVCLTEVKGEKALKLCGTAVFKEDKLIGFLDEYETKYIAFVLDEVEGGVIVVNVGEEDEKIALEILKNKTNVKAEYKEDKVSVEVKIMTSISIEDQISKSQFTTEKQISDLEKSTEQQLKENVESLITKVQGSGSDIFGFGRTVKRELPKVWKDIGKDWDKYFTELEVKIVPKIEIIHSGLLKKTIELGD